MRDMFERVSIHAHGSYLPHGAVFKVSRDILRFGDLMAFRLSRMELHNAHAKRIAERGAGTIVVGPSADNL